MDIVIVIVVLVFSAILHEVMHGLVAEKLGDPTPRLSGRLTLNPIPHIDPVMSILIPTLLYLGGGPVFAAAKPVPINPIYFKEGKKDLALVALAGPLTNIVLALLFSFFLKLMGLFFFRDIFLEIIHLNLILGILNLIPIPPLDGSKIFAMILPDKLAYTYLSIQQFGLFILFFLLFFPIGPFNLSILLNDLVLSALKILGV